MQTWSANEQQGHQGHEAAHPLTYCFHDHVSVLHPTATQALRKADKLRAFWAGCWSFCCGGGSNALRPGVSGICGRAGGGGEEGACGWVDRLRVLQPPACFCHVPATATLAVGPLRLLRSPASKFRTCLLLKTLRQGLTPQRTGHPRFETCLKGAHLLH